MSRFHQHCRKSLRPKHVEVCIMSSADSVQETGLDRGSRALAMGSSSTLDPKTPILSFLHVLS